jgi:hypothetical protein
MTDHPITPPLKLVQQWIEKYGNSEDPHWQTYECDIATQAARWGADQELEACCGFIGCTHSVTWSSKLRAARRPKPPSLKEQALAALLHLDHGQHNERCLIIRRALEQLDD